MDYEGIFLDIAVICDALSGNPSSRNFVEGEAILRSKHLILCEASKKTSSEICLYALCLQTSGLDSVPHTIEGTLTILNDKATIGKMQCTCKAGEGQRCKHIAATLLYCNRHDITKLNLVSSTDKKCIWSEKKGPALAQYEPKPLLETNCFSRLKSSIGPLDTEEKKFVLQELIKAAPNSAVAKHKSGRLSAVCVKSANNIDVVSDVVLDEDTLLSIDILNNIFLKPNPIMDWLQQIDIVPLYECCQNFYQKNIVCKDSLQLCVNTKTANLNSKELWKKERQFRITGSRCYSVYTYSKDNWSKKASKYFWPSTYCNTNMRHGIVFENIAREEYIKKMNVNVITTGLIVDSKNPWLGYSPDGVIVENNQPVGLLEIKCIAEGREKSIMDAVVNCKFLHSDINEQGEITHKLKKKHVYYGQVQLGMALLNVDITHFIVFASKDNSFILISVTKDINFLQEFLHKLKFNYFLKMLHYACINVN